MLVTVLTSVAFASIVGVVVRYFTFRETNKTRLKLTELEAKLVTRANKTDLDKHNDLIASKLLDAQNLAYDRLEKRHSDERKADALSRVEERKAAAESLSAERARLDEKIAELARAHAILEKDTLIKTQAMETRITELEAQLLLVKADRDNLLLENRDLREENIRNVKRILDLENEVNELELKLAQVRKDLDAKS